jgi:hypothetical protein
MLMKRNHFVFIATLALGLLSSGLANARSDRHNLTVSTNDHEDITNCSQVEMRFGHEETARAEDQFTLARKDVARLAVRPAKNGGMAVQGWDRDEYSIKACKAAGGSSESSARNVLGQISVSTHSGNVTAQGPGDEDSWVVFFIVQAPRNAVLDMETENGPIGFRHVFGKIEARAANSPISLRDCEGQVRVHTENGPIDFFGNSGDFRLDAQNGPVSVHLTGTAWQGVGLEARTENGPLTLRVPDGYSSGVRVESAGYSPFECNAPACDHAQGSWRQGHHSIEMGQGNALVRMQTVNGPVAIKSARVHDRDED